MAGAVVARRNMLQDSALGPTADQPEGIGEILLVARTGHTTLSLIHKARNETLDYIRDPNPALSLCHWAFVRRVNLVVASAGRAREPFALVLGHEPPYNDLTALANRLVCSVVAIPIDPITNVTKCVCDVRKIA